MDTQTQREFVAVFNRLLDECLEQYVVPGVTLLGTRYRIVRAFCADDAQQPFLVEMENPAVRKEGKTIIVPCTVIGFVLQLLELERQAGLYRTRSALYGDVAL